jgi:hypothetical protein
MWGLLGIWVGTLVTSQVRRGRDESVAEIAKGAAYPILVLQTVAGRGFRCQIFAPDLSCTHVSPGR